jgi:uncharacterized protein YcgI (DUF1989 family)
MTPQGKQVADFVAFSVGDRDEHVSTSATRATNGNIIPLKGMTLYSNRREPMFEIVEDTVGRHDMLYACCDPVRYEMLGAEPGHASCRAALTDALSDYEIGYDRIPSPVNWFMNVSIQRRGELEIREPLAEAGDYVLLRALKDVVAAVSACPQDFGETNAGNPTNIVIRVYRDEPLPSLLSMPGEPNVADAPIGADGSTPSPAATGGGEAGERASRRAARRAEKQAAAAATTETDAEPLEAHEAAQAQPGAAAKPARLQDTAEATVVRLDRTGAN